MRRHLLTLSLLALAAPAVADSWLERLFADEDVDRSPREPDYPKSDIPLDVGEPLGLFHYRMRLDYLVGTRGVSDRMHTGDPVRLDLYADDACEAEPIWTGWLGLTDPQVVVHDLDRWQVDDAGLAVATTEIRTVQDVYLQDELRGAFLVIDDPGLNAVGTRCQPQRLSRVPSATAGMQREGYGFSPVSVSSLVEQTEVIATADEDAERVDLGPADGKICMLTRVGFFSADVTGYDVVANNHNSCSIYLTPTGHWELVGSVSSLFEDDPTDVSVRCNAMCIPLTPMSDLVY